MNRKDFISDEKRPTVSQSKYREACGVFEKFQSMKKELQNYVQVFEEVEGIIEGALHFMPGYPLFYGYQKDGQAFEHFGDQFKVRFKVIDEARGGSVHTITISIKDVYELPQASLVEEIKGQIELTRSRSGY